VGISGRLLNEGETVVLHTRTHAKALLLPLLGLVVLLDGIDDRASHDEGV
jgi:hypothetical protein